MFIVIENTVDDMLTMFKPIIIGEFEFEDQAFEYMNQTISNFISSRTDSDGKCAFVADYENSRVYSKSGNYSCDWIVYMVGG